MCIILLCTYNCKGSVNTDNLSNLNYVVPLPTIASFAVEWLVFFSALICFQIAWSCKGDLSQRTCNNSREPALLPHARARWFMDPFATANHEKEKIQGKLVQSTMCAGRFFKKMPYTYLHIVENWVSCSIIPSFWWIYWITKSFHPQ